jgi:NAD(P)-dependent dehydrogenase (short-subunit alcohol dehydrogenase family)
MPAFSLSQNQPGRIIPVQMDVTDHDSIEKARKTVYNHCMNSSPQIRLVAIVNNAGVSTSLPVELTPLDKAKYVMNVNYFGALDVTKTFLPMFRDPDTDTRQGRIIFVSSVAGQVRCRLKT